jgi:hypothetical protein
MTIRAQGRARQAGAGRRAPLSVPVLAGAGYVAAWIASLSVGAPNPSVNASGSQVVADFAGHGGAAIAMFVLAEGVAAIALAAVVAAVAWGTRGRAPGRKARLAGQLGLGFGLAAAAVSWFELGLGAWLISAPVPQRRSGTAGTAYQALIQIDGAKMLLLAAMAVSLSCLALTSPALPRWLAPLGFVLGVALVVSGLGYLLLNPGLANSVSVSGILLLAFVGATGVTFGLRAGRAGDPETD